MVLNPSGSLTQGAKARLETPAIPFIDSGYCLTWFYHMLGPDIGKLNVYVKAGNRRGLAWSFGENVGDIWNEAEVTIKRISDLTNFTIVFEGYFLSLTD